jgi:hypothetical protein
MNISLKSLKIIFWLVTFNALLGFMLVSQLKPEVLTWRLATLQIMFSTIIIGLYFYVFRVFGKDVVTTPSNFEPRFNSRIKTQLWGLLMRTVWGAIGLGFVVVLLPLQYVAILVSVLVYAAVMIGGFINDGKSYDKCGI